MKDQEKMTGARFIAEMIKGYGISHVFYVDAILRKTLVDLEDLNIRRVVTHSEKAAAYMADGYARASLRPSLCMAQSVGAANLAAGLQDAYLALSPVIAMTGKKPPMFQYRHAYQEIQHAPLFEPVTKYNVDLVEVEQLPHLLRQAFREATSGAPSPVHLDVLGNMGREFEEEQAQLNVVVEEPFTRVPAYRPLPPPDDVITAARAIEAAQRPVIVAGGGARLSSAGPEVVALAEKCSIPVATSVNAKEIILESHPLNVGAVGSYSRWCANRVVWEADLVIYIGSHTGDQVTLDWRIPAVGTKIVQIDIDPTEIGRNYPQTIGVVGDAKASTQALIDAVEGQSRDRSWLERARELVAGWWEEVEPLRNSDATPIRPERLCKELTDWLPQDAVLVSDTGYSTIWTATMLKLEHPTQSYLRAAGSLGWAFPAALGAKCAVGERPVICFCGDGAFWYHLSELETARRHGINTITVINNNQAYSQSIDDILKVYEGKPGRPEELYRFREVNFANIAREMGCFGVRVENPQDIKAALQDAAASGLPAVVEVITDTKYRAPVPWVPSQE
jgi:acetolactate synthase-1/2/3 large subunit